MTNELIQPILELQQRLESAIETREMFVRMGYHHMVTIWDEELDYICEQIRKGSYAN